MSESQKLKGGAYLQSPVLKNRKSQILSLQSTVYESLPTAACPYPMPAKKAVPDLKARSGT